MRQESKASDNANKETLTADSDAQFEAASDANDNEASEQKEAQNTTERSAKKPCDGDDNDNGFNQLLKWTTKQCLKQKIN